MSRARLPILMIFLFTGCMLGPKYHRPALDIPEAWRFADPEAREADVAWWRQFDDPELNALIETALSENRDIKIAAARVEQFIGTYRTTRSQLFPQIAGNASGGRTRSTLKGPGAIPKPKPNPLISIQRAIGALRALVSPASASQTLAGASSAVSASAAASAKPENPVDLFDAGLSASWQLDIWGRLRSATEAARARILSAEEARRAVILTVVTSVATQYVNLADLDRQLEIARDTAQTREKSFKLFQLQFSRGIISALELNQSESEYQQALAAIPALERAVAQQEDALSVLLGRNPGSITRGRSIDDLRLPSVPAGLPSDLLENRPDLRQAEQDLIAANAEIGAARAQYFPAISLTGAYGWTSTSLSNLFSGPARSWNYSVPVTAPIFTAGGIAGQVQTAKAVQHETLENYKQAVQTAFRDVEDALVEEQTRRTELDAVTRQVQALQKAAYYARRRFDNGYTSYIEVLDAERSLFNAQLTLAQTKGALFQAMVRLYNAMGGGWVTTAESMTGEGNDVK